MTRQLLYVEWVDATGPQEEWTPLKKIASAGIKTNTSVGWAVKDDDFLVLVPHICDEDEDGFGDIAIPKGCIKKRRVLKCPT